MKLTLTILLFLVVAACTDNSHWLQGEWISDTAATISAMPGHESFSQEAIDVFSGVFGKLRWEFEGDVYRIVFPGLEPYETAYSLRSLDGAKEELTIEYQGVAIVLEINPTETGFCAKSLASGRYRSIESNQSVECFTRYEH